MRNAASSHQQLQTSNPVDHIYGSPSGVMVVEYGDFECPSCAKAYPDVKRLQRVFKGKIGFIFRNFPHPDIHPHSGMAAEAAEAAAAQIKFWAMHDLLFENHENLDNTHLRKYAESIELNLPRYDVEMGGHIYLQRVNEHLTSGLDSGVQATPTFFVNNKRVDTNDGISNLFAAVGNEIEKIRCSG